MLPQSKKVLTGDQRLDDWEQPSSRSGACSRVLVRANQQYELDAQCRLTGRLHIDLQSLAKLPWRSRLLKAVPPV